MLPLKTILCPTDFSPTSNAALETARLLALDYDATLIVLHVAELPNVMAGDGVLLYAPEYDPEAERRKLDDIPIDPEIAMERRFVRGDPVEEILETARARNCDLIVLGTHGRTGVGRLIMGSIAEQIIRKAPCPVMSVKGPVATAQVTEPEAALALS
jgi:nucleotide-binding universal stress UspA family protein